MTDYEQEMQRVIRAENQELREKYKELRDACTDMWLLHVRETNKVIHNEYKRN